MLPRTRSRILGRSQVGTPIMSTRRRVLPVAKHLWARAKTRSREMQRSLSIATCNTLSHSAASAPICEYSRAQCSAGMAKPVQSDAIFAVRRSVITERPVTELRSSTDLGDRSACTSAQYLMGSFESKMDTRAPSTVAGSRSQERPRLAPQRRQFLPGRTSRTRAHIRCSARHRR